MVGRNNNIRTIKSNLKEHYKAYKAGTRWIYASLASLALGAGLLLGSSTTTYADTATNNTQEPNETVSDNSAATAQTTSSVTLKSGDNTQTAADTNVTNGNVNGTSDANDSTNAAANTSDSASSAAEKTVKQEAQNTPTTTSGSEATTSDVAAQQADTTQAKTSKTLVNPTQDQLNAAKASADATYAATHEPQEIDAVDPASVAPLTISSTAVGYGSNAQSPLTLTLQINAKAGDVYKINIPADTAVYTFDQAIPLASSAGTTTTDNNSDGSHTITDIFTTNSTTTQPIKINLHNNFDYQYNLIPDAGKTVTKTITYSVNGIDQTPITFTQTIQPTTKLSTVSLLYPNSQAITKILPNQNYVFGVSVNEANGVQDDGAATARVNSAVNYGGTEIDIPVPTGFVLDTSSTNQINALGAGSTITQPGGKGTNVVISVAAGKGNQSSDHNAPEYKLVGAFDVAQTATDQTLTANGDVTFSQVINADGTKLTDSADPWSVTILPANADATQGTNVVLTSKGNSSLASDKLELGQDASDNPQYLNSFGFKFDSAAEAQNAKLTMTIPSGLDVTSIKTPVQGISPSSYLPDTSSWTFTFTLADGTTQTGTVNAGDEAKVTGNSAIRSAVFTPNKLAPGSYADGLGTPNSFLLAGQLSTTYDDGTAVKNGDQLTSSVDMAYDANGTSQNAQKSSATQTIVDNIALAQGFLVTRTGSSNPGNPSAGTLQTRYNDPLGQTTNKIEEPTFYFVIPKVTTVASINSLGWYTDDPVANAATTDPTGALLTQATGAKVSEFTADNGQTVVKIDYAGTGTTVDMGQVTGHWGAVTLANDPDALPGQYPYAIYIVSPTTKLMNTTKPTDLSFVENNPNAYLLGDGGSGNWTIQTASSFFNTSLAKGNQNVDAVQKATSDKNGDGTLTFYDNMVYTSLEDVAADHNASVAINLPTAGTDKSQYTFKLTGAIKMPTNYTTPSGDGTAINSTVLYSTQPQAVNTNATAPDTTGYVTWDQVTDWSTIRSIIIQVNGLKANTSTGRIAINGTTDDFKDQGGKTAYLQTIFYGDGAPASVSENDDKLQNEASITITGTSTIKARYHYVDADGNDQYVNLTDLDKTLNDGTDKFTNDYPTQLSAFSTADQALIPAGYKLETDASGKVTPTIVDGSTDGKAVFGATVQNSFDGDFVQYDLVGNVQTQVEYIDDDNKGAIVGTPQVISGAPGGSADWSMDNIPTGYTLAKNQVTSGTYTFKASGNMPVQIHLKHIIDESAATTTRTITYSGAGDKTPKAKSEPVTWTVGTDEVTGITTYTPSGDYEAVPTPSIAGYTADKDSVPAVANAATTTKPTDSTETVTYSADDADLTVNYVDTDNDNQVVETDTVTGKTDDTGDYAVTVPTNYVLAPGQDSTVSYQLEPGDSDNLTIKLKHVHSTTLPDGFTGTTTRTVTYTGAGTKSPADKAEPVTWTTDTDEVTGVTTYTPSGDYEAVPTPTIAGYTADKDSVPAVANAATTTKPTDSTETVTYSADDADLTVNYVDTDNDNQVVETDTVTGKTDDTGDYAVTVPTNYVLAPGQDSTVSYQLEPGDTDNLTIKLKHAHSTTLPDGFTGTTTRTVTYTGAGTKTPADKAEPVTWTTDTDEVTGVTTYTPSGKYEAVTTPTITGYTADKDSVPEVANAATTTKPTDSTVTVTYTADAEGLTVTYEDVDEDNAVVGTPETINGTTDETGTYTATAPTNYEFANADQPTSIDYTITPDDTDNIVIPVKHAHSTTLPDGFTGTTTRTVTYTGAGTKTPADKAEPVTWTTDTDEVTGVTTYTPSGKYEAVTTPTITGYTADKDSVPEVANAATTTKPTDSTVTVTYTADAEGLTVTYEDVDEDNAVVGTPETINGTTDETGTYTATAPTNYEFANADQPTSIDYTITPDDTDNIVIPVKHAHSTTLPDGFTGTTTRTVTYTGAGTKTPADKAEPVTWTTDTDEVTGVTTYTPSGKYEAVTTPTITGYTADKDSVPEVANAATTTKPTDSTVTVTYTADAEGLTVTYEDVDEDNAVVGTPETINGTTDETGTYTATAPTNYEFANADQPTSIDYTITPDDTDNIVIPVKHAHSTTLPDGFTGTTTRTVTYTGAGTKTPADKAEPVTWTTDTDEVTGVTTYTPSGKYEAVTTPTITGYTADKDSVPEVANAATTTKPTDSTVTVTYTADAEGLTVTYEDVDEDNAVVGTPETINGTTDETGTYTATAPTNYEFSNADQPTSIDYTITPDDTDNIVIPVKHAHSTTLPDGFTGTTTRTVTYTGAGTKTPADKAEPVTWTTDTDEVTGVTTYTPSGKYEAVTTPTITGYTADKDSVPEVANAATTTKPTDSTVTVTYTADAEGLTVTYEDVDEDNAVVGTPETINGTTDETGTYTATAPTNYEFANADQPTSIDYTITPDDTDNIVIPVKHAHSTTLPDGFTGTTTRTVTYTGAGSKTPADKAEPVTWTTDTDEVTGVTTYTPSGDYEAVPTPTIAGYTADKDSVPAVTNAATTTKPTDSTETVTYTPQAQSTTVEFVDDDDNGAIVGTPITLNGVTDETANWNSTGKPTTYDLAPDQPASGTYTFKADNNAPVIIHLVHKLDYSQTTSTRTIHYVVDDPSYTGLVPAPIVQTITWNVVTDEVTGGSVATPAGVYSEQTSPNLPGYIANPAKVSQQAVGSVPTQDVPMYNEDVVVTYTPQPSQPTGPIDGGVPGNQPDDNSDSNPTETPENEKTSGGTVTNTTTPGKGMSGTDANKGNGSKSSTGTDSNAGTGSNIGNEGTFKTSSASGTTVGSQDGSISNGNSNTSAANQQRLPQTNEQSQSTIGLGLLGLLTSMLGLVGLKRRKRDDE